MNEEKKKSIDEGFADPDIKKEAKAIFGCFILLVIVGLMVLLVSAIMYGIFQLIS